MMNEPLGKVHSGSLLWVTYCIFMPMHFMGIVGEPRRYANYTAISYLQSLRPLTMFRNLRRVCDGYRAAAVSLQFVLEPQEWCGGGKESLEREPLF